MKLLKPDWVNHDGKAIFGIDIHPDGTRFATGGQGEDCGLIIIWNVLPVVNEKYEIDENIPKMLCQMDEHTGCVNCLRWSTSGKYLASGGDDKNVIIWALSRKTGSSTVFGTGGTVVNIENWKCLHVLRGHLGDVLDIAWSPDDSYIATGSVDNSIIVWNAQKFPEIVHTIKGHHGLVKGVVFDPVGKYMASQSDDKTLCIWNMSDWSLEKKITEPFLESSGTTHALRLNWSPDGQYIVTAHAMNNGGPVAKIIERNGWKAKMDFVGHRKAITCVRFSDKILCSKESSKAQYLSCAIGSRDRTLSIWLTSLKRPLVVLHDLFENSIMDISWSANGYFLLACSLDGSVAYMDFTVDELGKAISTEEKYIFHKKTFGTSIKASKSLILSSVLENPEVLKHHQQQQIERVKKAKLIQQNVLNVSATSPIGGKFNTFPFKTPDAKHAFCSSNSNDSSSAKEVLQKQKETKTKEGKRRIVPVLLEPPPDMGDDEDIVDFTPNLVTSTLLPSNIAASKPSATPAKVVVAATSIKASPTINKSSTTTTITVKRKLDQVDNSGPSKKVKKRKEKEKTKSDVSTPLKSSAQSDNESQQTHQSYSSLFIPYPTVEARLSLTIEAVSLTTNKQTNTLEVENDLSENHGSCNYMKCFIGEAILWETSLASPITALAANSLMSCAGCKNNSLHVFTNKGRRVLPALMLDSHISILQCQSEFIMVITSTGYVSVWNVQDKSCLINKESLLPILKDSEVTITLSYMNESGSPIVSLSDHSVYLYDTTLSSWSLLTSDSVFQTTEINTCMEGSLPKGPLNSLQAPLHRLSKQMMRGLRMNQSKQQTNSIAYLESQVCSTLSMNSAEEYHFWLMTYARYLAQTGDESRLRDLCEDLLRPLNNNSNKKASKIMCYDKRDLLREILPIIASNLNFQRFYSEFQQQLDVT